MTLGALLRTVAVARLRRIPRIVELSAVVILTVALVVAGALMETELDESTQPLLRESASFAMVVAAAAVESPTIAERAAPVARVQSAQVESADAEAASPAQSGIAPGRLDPPEPTLPSSIQRYQVQRGETLVDIASASGVSVADLLRWNRQLNEDSVLIRGEWLWVLTQEVSAVADEAAQPSSAGESGRGGG